MMMAMMMMMKPAETWNARWTTTKMKMKMKKRKSQQAGNENVRMDRSESRTTESHQRNFDNRDKPIETVHHRPFPAKAFYLIVPFVGWWFPN